MEDVNRITDRVIGCAYTVSNSLGTGFVEKVYENALAHELRKAGLRVKQQYAIKVVYDRIEVGEFFADLMVENRVLVELKAVQELENGYMAQALNYLRASGTEICLLINFGQSKVQVKRLLPSFRWKHANPSQA